MNRQRLDSPLVYVGAHNVYYVKLTEHRIVMLQGDRRHAGTPEDSVISREQIAQVLVTALSNDAAKNKTFELVAERGEAQQDLTLLFAELRNDNPQKNDGVFEYLLTFPDTSLVRNNILFSRCL